MTEKKRQHATAVRDISEQLRRALADKRKLRVYHGSTNSTRPPDFKREESVDVSGLNSVILIDKLGKYALVEPNVPMDALVKATLEHGLIPRVVPEFPGITVGGAVQGGAVESSSFKYGEFHNACEEYEIVLGDGKIVRASRKNNPDLFWGTACSYGSLGVLTLVKLMLLPAKPFVRLAYYEVRSHEDAIKLMETSVHKGADYIDGIIFSKGCGVIMLGTLEAERGDLPLAMFSRARDEWFYLHVRKIARKYSTWEECIPIEDYFFRYDRGAFWMGRYTFSRVGVPFVRATRWALDFTYHTRALYRLLHATKLSQQHLIQDFFLPRRSALKFLDHAVELTCIYPIWLLPIRPGKNKELSPANVEGDLVIDIGIWGRIGRKFEKILAVNRELEKYAADLGGRKMLYAHAHYTPEEFWSIYDKNWYDALRKKYRSEDTFPDIYEKTHVPKKYRASILMGLFRLFWSFFL